MSTVHDPLANARLTGYGRPGFAAKYDEHRPEPPEALATVLLRLARTERPALVVDLGSGTGLSTMLWAPYADAVIGIEPLDEMRQRATAHHRAPNVRWEAAVAQSTSVRTGAADIVTCAQSFHHMEPESALTEIVRILRPGGVLAIYDYDVPPVVNAEADEAFSTFMSRVNALRAQHGLRSAQQRWDKDDQLERLARRFPYTREVLLHHTDSCSAERWVRFALSIATVPPVLELGLSDEDTGLAAFRRASARVFGVHGLPWHVSYRVKVAIK